MANVPRAQLIKSIITNNSSITSFQITDCCIHYFDFQSLFASTTKQWNVIDLSGCSMGDERFENFCNCFLYACIPVYIDKINVSLNCLTSSRAISGIGKLLHCCVIKKLIFSHHCSIYRRYIFNEVGFDSLQSVKP